MVHLQLISMKKNRSIIIAKHREILDMLATVDNLTNHIKTLMRDLKYIETNY